MNEQELNQKLAEWAGWTIEGDDVVIIHTEYPPNQTCQGYEAEYLCNVHQLNFTQSLDACFKWLVPKLFREFEVDDMEIKLDSRRDGDGYAWLLFGYTRNLQSHSDYVTSPALALCLAIEKLIDNKRKDE